MFSKYKKPAAGQKPANAPAKVTPIAEAAPAAPKPAAPEMPKPASMRRALKPAAAAPVDREVKRKQRMSEIKLELHRALLDNLNLAALEHATEADLRQEINDIAVEILAEKSIVLNREDRMTLNSELYDEVTGLGPLETLLKDETVNDILVNGPQQIFVERAGKLELTDITFKDVKVGADALLGEEGKALDALEATLDLALITLCAEASGAMEVACDQTLDYIKERQQFGVPIGKFQALQHRMVEMRMELEKVRSITMLAACSLDVDPALRKKRISAAKAQVGKSGRKVAEEAIQLFGGMGMMEETPVSHYAKRIVMIDHWLGDREYHLGILEDLIDVDDHAA